jgi:hypothetical protein
MSDEELLDGPIGRRALEILEPSLLRPIFNHSLRTYFFASAESRARGWDVDPIDVLIACLFHDSGTIADQSLERFEVVGADRALAFAREVGRCSPASAAIWDAVALHTSPGIAERHRPLTRAVRAGVLVDFGIADLADSHRTLIADLERFHPRMGVERVLVDAVVRAARISPTKAPAASWPADLMRGALLIGDSAAANPNF